MSERLYSKESGYKEPCQDHFDGYSYPDATFYTGLYLASLAFWFHEERAPPQKKFIIKTIDEILNTLVRLSRYHSYSSYQLAKKILENKNQSRDPLYQDLHNQIEAFPPSGYIIRADVGQGFEDYELLGNKHRNIEPSQDQYTTILYGLYMVKKYVSSQNVNIKQKVSQIAKRILSYMIFNNFVLKRPFDGKVTARGGQADIVGGPIYLAYPFLIVLAHLTDEKPEELLPAKEIEFFRHRYFISSNIFNSTINMRCHKQMPEFVKCNYFTYILFAITLAWMGEDPNLESSQAIRLFKASFPEETISYHQNVLIASLGYTHYQIPILASYLEVLATAPQNYLPNSWKKSKGWNHSIMRWDRTPHVFTENGKKVSSKACEEQYPGIDFILPYAILKSQLSKFR